MNYEKLFSKVNIATSGNKIGYKTKLFFIGSCFSENIAECMQREGMNLLVNPFGVLYNPASINNFLKRIINKKYFEEEDLEFNKNSYFSFDANTKFALPDKTQLLNQLNKIVDDSYEFIKNTDFLLLTFGNFLDI